LANSNYPDKITYKDIGHPNIKYDKIVNNNDWYGEFILSAIVGASKRWRSGKRARDYNRKMNWTVKKKSFWFYIRSA